MQDLADIRTAQLADRAGAAIAGRKDWRKTPAFDVAGEKAAERGGVLDMALQGLKQAGYKVTVAAPWLRKHLESHGNNRMLQGAGTLTLNHLVQDVAALSPGVAPDFASHLETDEHAAAFARRTYDLGRMLNIPHQSPQLAGIQYKTAGDTLGSNDLSQGR